MPPTSQLNIRAGNHKRAIAAAGVVTSNDFATTFQPSS
jgi:hypothetical protein